MRLKLVIRTSVVFWVLTTSLVVLLFASRHFHLDVDKMFHIKARAVQVSPPPAPKTIVFNWFPDYYLLESAQGTEIFSNCSKTCVLVVNETRMLEADAVVFYSQKNKWVTEDRLERGFHKSHNQVWVFFASESPDNSLNSVYGSKEWLNKFNWTMTYRQDSDIMHTYFKTIRRKTPLSKSNMAFNRFRVKEFFRKKQKMIAWFVSNCKTTSKREQYVETLKRFIEVDIYGRCSDQRCENRSECYEMLVKDYMFYLSFENSLCMDYATEKQEVILNLNGVIPVVRSRSDKSMLPPRSAVFTRDFASPQDLANYLYFLADHEDEYLKYFEWRRDWEVIRPNLPLCQLCENLYKTGHTKTYEDVHFWWTDDICEKSATADFS